MAENKSQSLFPDITGEVEPTVIESLCMNCQKQGKTTILLTKIPFFQEVVVVSFYCDECGFKNSELQPAGILKDHGTKITFTVKNAEDLNRDCVKSEHALLKIVELDFEIPASRSKGILNTLEGFVSNTIEDLKSDQEQRREVQPEVADKIDEFIKKLENILGGSAYPITVILDDPSGNSFIKNPHAPKLDPQMKFEHYSRTSEQLAEMGYSIENAMQEKAAIDEKKAQAQQEETKVDNTRFSAHKVDFNKPLVEGNLKEEAMTFPTICHGCGLDGENQMCTISVPYFKELIIMSFLCEYCGVNSREVKVGGSVSDKAKKITLKVDSEEDIKRDLFKSESAVLMIPELELELTSGTLGGVYTTVEGLIEKILDHIKDNNPFLGDSSENGFRTKMDKFFEQLEALKAMKSKWTLIIDDPMDNSFVQNPKFPLEDPQVTVEIYDRTWDQNEEFGLNDIKTESYAPN